MRMGSGFLRDANFPVIRDPGIPPAKKSAVAYAALSGSNCAIFTNNIGRKFMIAESDSIRKMIVKMNIRKCGSIGFLLTEVMDSLCCR